ncbi:MAG: SurA N-terminal domain-containing protein, partial [Nitrospinae bacterium]|nr:SurA N-terminal domain-containing protein [Nitrospinota bacterium]
MLKLLRKKGVAKKVIWFVAILIIFSFGFLGTAYLITGNNAPGYAGRIFGKKISVEDFSKVYQNARIQAVRKYGYNLNKVAHLLNLEAQTWDLLILLRETKKRKIKIPNNEIVKAIEEDNSFQKNNQFDVLLYNTILRNLQIRPRDYDENVRDNLK